MAKVVGPLHSSEARGRCGPLVYNTWRGVRFVKDYAAPLQPDSGEQLDVRARLADVSGSWPDLTDAQRTAWDQYAREHPLLNKLGGTFFRTGHNWYTSCNAILTRYGITAIELPPTIPPPASPHINALTTTTETFYASWAPIDPASPGDHMVQFRLQGPNGPGRKNDFHHAVFNDETWDYPGTFDVYYGLPGYYGIWLRRVSRVSGLVSPWQMRRLPTWGL